MIPKKPMDLSHTANDVFESLKQIEWRVATQTYGNHHSTLIGLIVHWWITQAPELHIALEAAPPHGYKDEIEKGLGKSDALLCQNGKPVCVVEVEGTKWEYTAKKIGYYFDSTVQMYKDIDVGILFLYVTGAKGKGVNRLYPSAAHEETINLIEQITKDRPGKAIILITLDKKVLPVRERIMNNAFLGQPNKIEGKLYIGGKVEKEFLFYVAS